MVLRESDDRADTEITLQSPQWKHVELPGRPGAGRASFKLFFSARMVIARSTEESHKWGCQKGPTDAQRTQPSTRLRNSKCTIAAHNTALSQHSIAAKIGTEDGTVGTADTVTVAATYARSPRMRRASWMSVGMTVTRLA